MKEELYMWIRNLAVFYILFTALLHLVPDGKYQRYVRFFMGLLLIIMLSTPVLSIFGKSGELWQEFQRNYKEESALREKEELKDLQEFYLEKGYEWESKEKITEKLKESGIPLTDASVDIEEGRIEVLLYFQEEPDKEMERRIENELEASFEIGKDQYKILVKEDGLAAVGGAADPGTASGGTLSAYSKGETQRYTGILLGEWGGAGDTGIRP